MINPFTQYPGKLGPVTADYPYGTPRDISTPGDGSGTPWEAALINDWFGFQAALLDGTGIGISGNPEERLVSDMLEAFTYFFGCAQTQVQNGTVECGLSPWATRAAPTPLLLQYGLVPLGQPSDVTVVTFPKPHLVGVLAGFAQADVDAFDSEFSAKFTGATLTEFTLRGEQTLVDTYWFSIGR